MNKIRFTSPILTILLLLPFLFMGSVHATAVTSATCGALWKSVNPLTTNTLRSVARGGNTLVSVGMYGTILTSNDGTAWISRSSGVTSNLFAVAWGENQFVAVGYTQRLGVTSGTILTSPDGVTWANRALETRSEFNHSFNDVTWGNNQFVAVALDGTILTSNDGITWTTQSSGTTDSLWGVTWGNSRFVAVGGSSSILTSTDGVTWAWHSTNASGGTLFDVAWGDNRFVAVGSTGTILTSPDGLVWSPQTMNIPLSINASLYGVAWLSDQFISVGYDGTSNGVVLTSTDGITWTVRSPGTARVLNGVAWIDGQFAIVGQSGTILTSPCSTALLTISPSGTGSGFVTSNPSGVNCGGCSAPFSTGTNVALTATAISGSTFAGWSGGGCSGVSTCLVAMNADTTVTASFNATTSTTAVKANKQSQTIRSITFSTFNISAIGGTTTVSASATSGLPVSFSSITSSICTVSGSTVKGTAAGTCTIAANQSGSTTYSAAPQITASITVNKTAQKQTISSFSLYPTTVTVGNTATASASATSKLQVVFSSLTSSICTVSGNTVKGTAAGTCTIAANQNGNSDYAMAPQVTQNISITKQSQTINSITFYPTTLTVGNTTTVSATTSSGLAPTFSATPATVCTSTGNAVKGIAAGTCTIAANQAGNGSYVAAAQRTQTINVTGSTYTLNTFTSGTGAGTISGNTTSGYSSGTKVILTATSASNSTFAGWSGGGCSGTGPCTVIMTANTSVTASFTLIPALPGVDFASSAYRADNPFWKSGYAPARFYSDSSKSLLGQSKGNCTWYANGRLRQVGYNTASLNILTGNAGTWANLARNANITVDSHPSVGAIAQINASTSYQLGHVAVVENVNADGSLWISESSYATPGSSWDFESRTRKVAASTFDNYIHVKKP